MASRTVIPRFLLPMQSPLWRGIRAPPQSLTISVRYASKQAGGNGSNGDKPIVLGKPDKFNPPSHGSRLKRNNVPRHYGPTLTAHEVAEQNQKHYPGLMAPQGTWTHWVWHSRFLHTVITLGTLLAMAIFTFFMNYAQNSPFKHLLPPFSDLWHSPLEFMSQWRSVIIMHEKDKAIKASEHRYSGIDDAAKRKYFMKMHGIETKNPVHIVFGKPEEESVEELEAAALGLEPPPKEEKRKKWFGIF